jgi:RHS repeat-associated protein
VFRKETDVSTGTSKRVIYFGKLAEIRPDERDFLTRIDVNGATVVEETRDLTTGTRVASESGFLFGDVRGSVLARTSFDGPATVVQREAEYEAWGDTIVTSGVPAPTHAFVGHEPDPSDGFYHFGRRVYDPTLRRWLSPDPLLFAAPELDEDLGRELNLYSYAGNNPVRYVDPSGMALDEATGDLLFAVAVAAAQAGRGEFTKAGQTLVNGYRQSVQTFKANQAAGNSGKPASLGKTAKQAAIVGLETVKTLGPFVLAEQSAVLSDENGDAPGGPKLLAGETAADAARAQGDALRDIAADPDLGRGVIYEIPGVGTNSGNSYLGSADNLGDRGANATDGRKRGLARVIDSYAKGDRDGRRIKEDKAIQRAGGVGKTDNKRREIAEKNVKDYPGYPE